LANIDATLPIAYLRFDRNPEYYANKNFHAQYITSPGNKNSKSMSSNEVHRKFVWPDLLIISLIFISIVACQSNTTLTASGTSPEATQTIKDVSANNTQLQNNNTNSIPTSSVTQFTQSLEQLNTSQETQPIGKVPSPAPDPLRFSFPTANPAPISAWRPPLYPTPWALSPYDHFYFSRPIAANDINWPLADYRYGGVFFSDVVHTGVDIPAHPGTPVLAAGQGKVTWAGYGLYHGIVNPDDPYGLAVLIRHDFGYQGERLYTMYGHLSRVDVQKGQHVETGEQIGLSGQTGMVTGPHLHFEVRLGQDAQFTTRNPELWLVPPQGWGILAGRVMNNHRSPIYGQIVDVVSQESGQVWKARTYSQGNVRSDEYYYENVVISDLPAGRYDIYIRYLDKNHSMEIEIGPGQVSYFTFQGRNGFSLENPTLPGSDFTPPPP
jgi:murein DD-endopeptidase MepM/ murein hydrolase activator NlpD